MSALDDETPIYGFGDVAPEYADLIRDAAATVDLDTLRICREVGCAFEGQLKTFAGVTRCVGRCARCGLGYLTDGS